MLELIDRLFPYLIAFTLGACGSAFVFTMQGDARVATQKAAYEKQIGTMEAEAALAEAKALTDHHAQEGRIATLDAQLTTEKQAHETDTRNYAAAIAAGTSRMRIAVTRCSPDHVPAAPGTARVDDGGPALADIAPETAIRLVDYAGDDQREIDKLKGLQAYVCSIIPDAAACKH